MNTYRVVPFWGNYWVDLSADGGPNWKAIAMFVGPGAKDNAKEYIQIKRGLTEHLTEHLAELETYRAFSTEAGEIRYPTRKPSI